MVKQNDDLKPCRSLSSTSLRDIPADLINSLSFDETTKQLEALKELIFNASETNQSKLHFLKEEIAAGRYEIESDAIAARLIEYNDFKEVELETELA